MVNLRLLLIGQRIILKGWTFECLNFHQPHVLNRDPVRATKKQGVNATEVKMPKQSKRNNAHRMKIVEARNTRYGTTRLELDLGAPKKKRRNDSNDTTAMKAIQKTLFENAISETITKKKVTFNLTKPQPTSVPPTPTFVGLIKTKSSIFPTHSGKNSKQIIQVDRGSSSILPFSQCKPSPKFEKQLEDVIHYIYGEGHNYFDEDNDLGFSGRAKHDRDKSEKDTSTSTVSSLELFIANRDKSEKDTSTSTVPSLELFIANSEQKLGDSHQHCMNEFEDLTKKLNEEHQQRMKLNEDNDLTDKILRVFLTNNPDLDDPRSSLEGPREQKQIDRRIDKKRIRASTTTRSSRDDRHRLEDESMRVMLSNHPELDDPRSSLEGPREQMQIDRRTREKRFKALNQCASSPDPNPNKRLDNIFGCVREMDGEDDGIDHDDNDKDDAELRLNMKEMDSNNGLIDITYHLKKATARNISKGKEVIKKLDGKISRRMKRRSSSKSTFPSTFSGWQRRPEEDIMKWQHIEVKSEDTPFDFVSNQSLEDPPPPTPPPPPHYPPNQSSVFLVEGGLDKFNLDKNEQIIDLDRFWVETNNIKGLLRLVGTSAITIVNENDVQNREQLTNEPLSFTVSKDSRMSWYVAMRKDRIPANYNLNDDTKASIRIGMRMLVVKLFNKALREDPDDKQFLQANETWKKSNALISEPKTITLTKAFLQRFGSLLNEEGFKCILTQFGQKSPIASTTDWLPELVEDADIVEVDFGFRLESESFPDQNEVSFAPLLLWSHAPSDHFGQKTKIFEMFPMVQKMKHPAGWLSCARPTNKPVGSTLQSTSKNKNEAGGLHTDFDQPY